MLTQDERDEITAELERYEAKSAACIDALRIVQQHRGWVSDDAIRDVAEFLELTPAEVDGVATFYNLIFRRPVGKHVVFICDSVSCWIMGSEGLQKHVARRLGIGLGETTADGSFTLLPIACLGDCDKAPSVMIDGEHYTNLDTKTFDDLLVRLRRDDDDSTDRGTT